MKILVPIDFSFCSSCAALYAAHLARDSNAALILLHLVNFEPPPLARISVTTEEKIEQIQLANAYQEAEDIMDALHQLIPNLPVEFYVDRGEDLDIYLQKFAEKEGVDLIVMGTKGVSGIKKILIGSKAISVMQRSLLPLITIPENTSYAGIKKILFYVSDLVNLTGQLKELVAFAKIFDAQINAIFFQTAQMDSGAALVFSSSELRKDLGYDKLSFSSVECQDPHEDLQKKINEQKPDLLALFTHPHPFLEKIYKGQLSEEMASSPLLPLLTYNRPE